MASHKHTPHAAGDSDVTDRPVPIRPVVITGMVLGCGMVWTVIAFVAIFGF